MKKVLVIIGLCLLAGYLIFSAFFFESKPDDMVCSQFEIVADNDSTKGFLELAEIEKDIDSKGLNPYGKQLKDINTYSIEQAILSNQLIKSAEVFVTSKGGIKAIVAAKNPILRVMPEIGESYYIDSEAQMMPLTKNLVVSLPIATGAVKEDFAKKDLYRFAAFLRTNDFWNTQIEQINVLPNQDLELIPRIGDHKILLGTLDNFEDKLERLLAFYQKGLNETGWNRYSLINLKYDKQVVCTKR